MSLEAIESDFPNLRGTDWRKSSEIDDGYNCIAFAVHDTRQYWDPNIIGLRGYYWPPGVPRDDNMASWIKVFEIHAFRVCEHGELEPGLEKIAIYADENQVPTHVARQLNDGTWTSKLGPYEDIEHRSLRALESYAYGNVAVFMKRAVSVL